MTTKIKIICTLAVGLLFTTAGGLLFAQNPGDQCDPGLSVGHTVRIVSMSGTVTVHDQNGQPVQIGDGSVIKHGSKIVINSNARAVLALEDGTEARSSRIRIDPGSQLVLTGGLYCSDLRPKLDEGRWSAREARIELLIGRLEVGLAEGVSYSYNLEVATPNAVARMVRGTQDEMKATFSVTGLDDRPLVSIIDHPEIRSHVSALLMGRSIDDLSPREKEGVMTQAAMTAFSMGLIDMEETDILENPQIRSTMDMMTRGRNLSELDEGEKGMIMQGVAGMAMQQGLINPETLKVHSQPDELTNVTVRAGKMRVHNKHRGWNRNEAVDIESGMFTVVKGYDIPTGPHSVD